MTSKRALAKANAAAADLIDIDARLAGFLFAEPKVVVPAGTDQPES